MRVLAAILISLLFYGLVFFEHDILIYTSGDYSLLHFFITSILYLIIVINFLRCLYQLFIKKEFAKKKIYTSITIYVIILLSFHFSPYNSSEIFRSPVVEEACYEGTVNTSSISFREDKSFELWQTAFIGLKITTGKYSYSKQKDTLYLIFSDSKPENVSDRYYDSANAYYPINPSNGNPKTINFYKGRCRRLN